MLGCLQSVFDDLKPKLSLQSLTSNSRSAEHMETAVLMLGMNSSLSAFQVDRCCTEPGMTLTCCGNGNASSSSGEMAVVVRVQCGRASTRSHKSMRVFTTTCNQATSLQL